MSELPARLKAMRDLRGLTQRQLAKKMNVSPSTIALYETGDRNPDPQMLKRLADCLDCSVDYLLGRTVLDGSRKLDGTYKLNGEKTNKGLETEAAHRADDPMSELPDEAKKSLEEFKEFIFRKYGKGSG
ncbi:MAG: helix-turn-helix transcriptional regulator [Firmicutes bacterium]|nr:helix-turn-helix transcriptional regulator [Bacillota bacterium]